MFGRTRECARKGREKEMRKEWSEKVADVATQVTLSQRAKCKNANENKCGYSGYTRTCAHVHADTLHEHNKQRQPILYLLSRPHSPVNLSCFV